MAGAHRFIQHFSHPHPLELSTFQSPQGLTNPPTLCSCCELPPSGQICICWSCNFMLHLGCLHFCCSQFRNSITHPAHGNHPLTLLSTAAYPSGQFICNACRKPGRGFNYHCSHCSYDLHAICAHMPSNFTHQSHPCRLSLTFEVPFVTTTCNICRMFIGSNEWHYRCSACNFDVHLSGCSNNPSPVRGVVGPWRPTGLGTALAQRIAEVIGLRLGSFLGQAILGGGIGGDQGSGYGYVDSSSIWDSLISVFGF
nr:uncharacterized protein LOC113741949 [Coffea arabica]